MGRWVAGLSVLAAVVAYVYWVQTRDGQEATHGDPRTTSWEGEQRARDVAEWRSKLDRIARAKGAELLQRLYDDLGLGFAISFGGAIPMGDWRLVRGREAPFLLHDEGEEVQLPPSTFVLFLDDSGVDEEPPPAVGEGCIVVVGTPDQLLLIDIKEGTFSRLRRRPRPRHDPPSGSFEEAAARVQEAHRQLGARLAERSHRALKHIVNQPSDEEFDKALRSELGICLPRRVDGAYPLRGGWSMVVEGRVPVFDGPDGQQAEVPPSVFVRFFGEETGLTRSAPQSAAVTSIVVVGTGRHYLLVEVVDGAVCRIER